MQKAEDHILVIFGASGDLTRRKLIPALAELLKLKLLPDRFAVLGIGRSKFEDASYREMIAEHIEDHSGMLPLLHYQSMDPEDGDAYPGLARRLALLSKDLQIAPNYIFYLATPPSLYGSIPQLLCAAGLTGEENGLEAHHH